LKTSISSGIYLYDIQIENRIGGGNSGNVFLGKWGLTRVALKSLKDSESPDFVRECLLLSKLRHPNIVTLLGIFENMGVRYMVLEFVSRGSLSSVLVEDKNKLGERQLVEMILGAASGMQYLESNNVLHRDLACRNLLCSIVDDVYHVKLSDFGLSRISSVFKISDSQIPIRWTAPEIFEGGLYSNKADVWSFGVVMWEIFSFGSLPYDWLSSQKVVEQVSQKVTLPYPANCSSELCKLMTQCWSKKPEARPNFTEIAKQLSLFYTGRYIEISEIAAKQDGMHYFQPFNVESIYYTKT